MSNTVPCSASHVLSLLFGSIGWLTNSSFSMHLFVLPNLYEIHNILVSGELLQVFDKGSKLEQEEQINAADLDYLLLMVVVTKIRKKKIFCQKFRQIDVWRTITPSKFCIIGFQKIYQCQKTSFQQEGIIYNVHLCTWYSRHMIDDHTIIFQQLHKRILRKVSL